MISSCEPGLFKVREEASALLKDILCHRIVPLNLTYFHSLHWSFGIIVCWFVFCFVLFVGLLVWGFVCLLVFWQDNRERLLKQPEAKPFLPCHLFSTACSDWQEEKEDKTSTVHKFCLDTRSRQVLSRTMSSSFWYCIATGSVLQLLRWHFFKAVQEHNNVPWH